MLTQTNQKEESIKLEMRECKRNRWNTESLGYTLKTYKLESLKTISKFINSYHLPQLNQEDLDNLNKSTTSSNIKTVICIFKAQWHIKQLLNFTRFLIENWHKRSSYDLR